MSLTPSAQVPSLSLLGSFTTDHVFDLAFSPDSSKVVIVLSDDEEDSGRAILSIWCKRSASLTGRASLDWSSKTRISFSADCRDILLGYKWRDSAATLLRFRVVPTHLETYMDRPPKSHPPKTHTIEYSHYISGGTIDDYASHVDTDGWILNTKGEREIWTPWTNYEVLCSCQPPQKGQTQYRTLKVQDPETKTVVLIYVISFERKDVNNGIQEALASVDWRNGTGSWAWHDSYSFTTYCFFSVLFNDGCSSGMFNIAILHKRDAFFFLAWPKNYKLYRSQKLWMACDSITKSEYRKNSQC